MWIPMACWALAFAIVLHANQRLMRRNHELCQALDDSLRRERLSYAMLRDAQAVFLDDPGVAEPMCFIHPNGTPVMWFPIVGKLADE